MVTDREAGNALMFLKLVEALNVDVSKLMLASLCLGEEFSVHCVINLGVIYVLGGLVLMKKGMALLSE